VFNPVVSWCLIPHLWLLPLPGGSLKSAFQSAGQNAPTLARALRMLPPEHRAGAEFLIRNMPAVDLAEMSDSLLFRDVESAYRAWRLFPWTRQIPEAVFLHYVLPHRVTQEPLSDWRPMFFDSLYPRVKDCTSMTEAALEVNKWCGERVKYKPNAPRDQGPLQTLKSGWGRCEEMVIVHIDACRAVGIPAREAYTPYWPMMESNHAWSEVWVDGKWYYMGACEPAARLNDAWFNKSVLRTGLVFAVSYGVPGDDSGFYRKKGTYAIVNNTGRYTRTGTIAVRVTRGNVPLKDVPVCFSVFNSGALRPIAWLPTDRAGTVSLPIGEGDYVVTAGPADRPCSQVATSVANTTRLVKFDLAQPTPLSERFWLWTEGDHR
jgi:hypothetical protein